MSAARMADCTQKLQATVSAAVESWQTGFNSLIVQHVRFNRAVTPLFDLQYKQQSIWTARGQWHHCLISCRVVRSRDLSAFRLPWLVPDLWLTDDYFAGNTVRYGSANLAFHPSRFGKWVVNQVITWISGDGRFGDWKFGLNVYKTAD